MSMKGKSHDEWYTPLEIINPIKDFLGGIDLDPASNANANLNIKASTYKTLTDELTGLEVGWSKYKSIWINPPYCHFATRKWIDKSITEMKRNIDDQQIIMLVNRSDAKWYYEYIEKHFDAYYQFRKRIKFINGLNPNERSSPRYNNDLIYFGHKPKEFLEFAINSYGDPVPSTRYKGYKQLSLRHNNH